MYHHNFVFRLQGHFCIGNVHWSRCHLQICVTSYSSKAQKIFILHLELASYLLLTSSIKVWGHFSHWYVCWTWSMKLLDLKCYSLCPIFSQLSVSFVTILLLRFHFPSFEAPKDWNDSHQQIMTESATTSVCPPSSSLFFITKIDWCYRLLASCTSTIKHDQKMSLTWLLMSQGYALQKHI